MNSNLNIPYSFLLEQDELDLLANRSSLVKYGNKDNIYKQNTRTSHLMLVQEGLIKVYKENRNDRNFILKLAKAGEFIGLSSIFGDDTFQGSASAIGPCEIWFVDINSFRSVLQQNGKFALKYLSYVAKQELFIQDRLISQISKQLPGRIADVILYFSSEIYNSTKFDFPITRKELAELAGTTKESFIRTLTEFKNDKIIEIDGATIEIKSMDIIKTLHNLG